jgi:hypothetical protein
MVIGRFFLDSVFQRNSYTLFGMTIPAKAGIQLFYDLTIKVFPLRIIFLYQFQLPASFPFFSLLFS